MAKQVQDSDWQYLFQSAVLENDREKRRQKAELAENAIKTLLNSLPAGNPELNKYTEALQSLRILKS